MLWSQFTYYVVILEEGGMTMIILITLGRGGVQIWAKIDYVTCACSLTFDGREPAKKNNIPWKMTLYER